MKAIVCTGYGQPDNLQLREVDRPVPKPHQVLIKIRATTVTTGDCDIRKFKISFPFSLPLRIILGIAKPKVGIFGQELAGDVEDVGSNIRQFRKGDHVFAFTAIHLGAHAEYICLAEKYLTPFNINRMTYFEGATIPTGGINGLHFVNNANIRAGDKVLINGAGGSIGTYALQFAKSRGAKVTCVDSAIKLKMLRDLGADRVIDYSQEDFSVNGDTYDAIIDVIGTSSFARCMTSLTPRGTYVLGNPSFAAMLRAISVSRSNGKKVIFRFADYKKENLLLIRDLIEGRKLKAVIDKKYPLDKMVEAHRYVEAGLKCGNVVIAVEH